MSRVVVARMVLSLLSVLALPPPLMAQDGKDAAEAPGGKMTVVSTESPSQREGSEASEPVRLSMEFQDANLKDVLKAFSAQTGINVIASEEVGDRTVTLYLEGVTAMDALDQILQASALTYERPVGSQIYIVKPKDTKPKITTITRVYPLKYARVSTSKLAKAVEQLSSSSSSTASSLGSASTSSGSSTSGTSSGGSSTSGGAGVGIDQVIEKILTEDGKVVVDERTNRLIVTDIAENFPQIEAVINSLDIRTAQILVEVEMLETTLSKLKDLGIEWGTGSEGELVTFAPGSVGRKTRFPFGWLGHTAPSGSTAFDTSTLSFASFKGSLQALESDADTKVLARPKVLTLDNESAVIKLTSNQAVGFSTTSTQSTGSTGATPERTTTGVSLTVTPQVNDGGFVTMAVEPSVTKVVAASVTPPSTVGGTVVDPKTRSAKVVVRVRNGDTLVLGGLIDRSDQETIRRVPILSGIPILGEAFKNDEVTNSTSELVVFVTPRIITEPPATRMASVGPGPFAIREQENGSSRQSMMEEALKRLEQPRL